MHFIFDSDVAKDVGTNAAVLFDNIGRWVLSNALHGRNIYESESWTFNSASAYEKFFEYMSIDTIKRELKKLVDEGYIKKGCFNKSQFDRTSWYTLTEKGWHMFNNGKIPQCKNAQSHSADLHHDIVRNCTDNTNINQYNNNNTISSEQSSFAMKLDDGSDYILPQSLVDEFKQTYSKIDVEDELKRMAMWLECNPSKRKTKRGIKRFINSWLSKGTSIPPTYADTPPSKQEEKPMDYSDWML